MSTGMALLEFMTVLGAVLFAILVAFNAKVFFIGRARIGQSPGPNRNFIWNLYAEGPHSFLDTREATVLSHV